MGLLKALSGASHKGELRVGAGRSNPLALRTSLRIAENRARLRVSYMYERVGTD